MLAFLVCTSSVHASALRTFTAPPCFRSIASADGHVLHSDGAAQLRDVVGVRPLLTECMRLRLLDEITRPSFEWTTARHANFPTTDVEVHSMPWLDAEMAKLLSAEIFPSIARLFDVDASKLFVRDQFVVKYSGAAGAQAALGSHFDESCFSFVVQLNDPAEFAGGGTLFDHATEAVSAPPGHYLLFCGYNYHQGVAVTAGCRYILTGFVDYRDADDAVAPFYGTLPGPLPRPYGAGSHDFPSPHLPTNLERLKAAYGSGGGRDLIERIAHAPPALPHCDTSKLALHCSNYLASGFVPDERFYWFLQAVVGDDEQPAEDEQQQQEAEAEQQQQQQSDYVRKATVVSAAKMPAA